MKVVDRCATDRQNRNPCGGQLKTDFEHSILLLMTRDPSLQAIFVESTVRDRLNPSQKLMFACAGFEFLLQLLRAL